MTSGHKVKKNKEKWIQKDKMIKIKKTNFKENLKMYHKVRRTP